MNPGKKSPHGVNTHGVSTHFFLNLEGPILEFSNQLCLCTAERILKRLGIQILSLLCQNLIGLNS